MAYHSLLCCRKRYLVCLFALFFHYSQAQNKFSRVDDWLKQNVQDLGGRVVLQLYKNDKIVYTGSQNNLSSREKTIIKFIARRQGEDPSKLMRDFDPQSKAMIASSSKWLSAALVMTFVDEGKLNLEDSIGKYLPSMTRTGKGNIRIWQCLSHLTGIRPGDTKEDIQEMKNIGSMDEAIERISSLPMEGDPGKTFHYSSIGLQIAGAILEKIGGKSFNLLFAERIAKPCNMKNTDFGKGNVAIPAGSGYSTTEDYIHFLVMILNDGKFNNIQVISKSSVIKMQQNYSKEAKIISSPAEAGNWGYGLGEWVMDDGDGRSLSVSSPGLFGSFPWVDNSRHYAGFLFCLNLKRAGRHDKYRELKGLIDEALK